MGPVPSLLARKHRGTVCLCFCHRNNVTRGLTDAQQRVPTPLGEFTSGALAGTCDPAKVSPRHCCATCSSDQRKANVCINFFLSRLVVLAILPSAQRASSSSADIIV